jgi:hypothetical protein
MEAVMESAVSEREPRKPRRESGMRKVPTRKMAAAKMRAAAHATEMHPSSHAAAVHPASHATAMHPASHAAAMHPTSHAAAMATAAAATTATSECRWRQSKRRTERTRDQAPQELVVHPNSSVVGLFRRIDTVARRRPANRKDPMISNDKCDSF